MLFQLPRQCRVYTAILPANQWGWEEILANRSAYLLELLVWMKSKDAQRKQPRNRPKPFVPDFLKPKAEPTGVSKEIEALDRQAIDDILKRPRV